MSNKLVTIMTSIFGVSWKTSFFSFLAAFATYFTQVGVKFPETAGEWGSTAVAALIFAWGKSSKDSNVTNSVVPSEPKKVPSEIQHP